jgi:hypothetical protein
LDIVYKYSHKKAIWHELRYSLRSLKNIPHDRVFIVGDKPEWIQNVIHVPFEDFNFTNKDCNIIAKLLKVCQTDISEDFIQMSDDMIICKPVDADYFREPIVLEKFTAMGKWMTKYKNTVKVLKSKGKQGICFEAHCPYVLNKLTYPEILAKFEWKTDILGNTAYFNYLGKEGKKGGVLRFKGVGKFIYDNEVILNYNDNGLTQDVKKFICERFQEKSIYEANEVNLFDKRRKTWK